MEELNEEATGMIIVAVIIYFSLKKRFSERAAPFGGLISLLLATAISSVFSAAIDSSPWALADLVLAGGTGLWLYFRPGWPALVGAVGYQVVGWLFLTFVVSIGGDINTMLPSALGMLVTGIYTITGSLNFHRMTTTQVISE